MTGVGWPAGVAWELSRLRGGHERGGYTQGPMPLQPRLSRLRSRNSMRSRDTDSQLLTFVAGLRRDVAAVLRDRPEAAIRLFRAAWDAYRPNVPDYEWSAHLDLPPGDVELVHWYLFFAAFMSAARHSGGEQDRPDFILAACVVTLTGLGCDEDAFGRQFDLLENIFLAYLRDLRLPADVVRRLCELLSH